jgi:tetratricopeptide (TPR) repeat protein
MTSASPGHFPEMPADRYRIERELGRGGMATVYLALDLKHDRRVALKVLDPKAHAPLAPERFQREIRFAARLQHPHILPVFDSGAAAQGDARPSLLWFSMPYVEGESLRQRLRREGRLPIADAVRIATDVARALAYAHGEGLVHRDIKPENILLTGQGDSLVADFGVGRALAGEADEREVGGAEAVLTGAGAVVGTPAYMSLEQIDGDRALDGRADIYSLGVVLYEMLTGQLPFAGSGLGAIVARQLSGPPRLLRPAREEVSPALEAVVLRMLARDPVDRYASAGEVADALDEVQRSATHRRVPSARSGAKWVAGGLAALILAAVIGGALRRRATPAPALRPSVVAIAPFDVPDPDLALWREGLVDLLSRNLDGAGPLRTVPPTVIIRRWAGRADPPSVAALGLRTGAELALFGSLLGSGPDSVRLRATLLDVAREQPLGEWEVSDATDRMDRLADSLTLHLLEELGRTRPIGAVRRGGLGLTRLPVLKAFLQGEQYFRRSEWDSAVVHYGRAVALDSGFAPALRRMGHAIGWTDGGFEGVSADYRFRAGAHNHGLPARDSLLVVAESLFASVLDVGPLAIRADTGWSARLRRLFATLAGATSRYRDDPEVWFLLGDVHSHLGAFAGRSYEQQLEAYDRAIALDSAFTPSYNHAIWASGRYGETAMRRYLRAYLALGPEGMWADGARLLQRLLDSTRVATGLTVALDGVPDSALIAAFQSLGLLPDSTELAVQLGRFIVLRPRSMPRPFSDPRFMRGQVARLLLARGHLRGSREYLAGHEQSLF